MADTLALGPEVLVLAVEAGLTPEVDFVSVRACDAGALAEEPFAEDGGEGVCGGGGGGRLSRARVVAPAGAGGRIGGHVG